MPSSSPAAAGPSSVPASVPRNRSPWARRVALATVVSAMTFTVVIPVGGAAAGGGPTAPAGAPQVMYVVKWGDNLFRIAIRLGVSLDSLLQTNHLEPSSLIVPGDQLLVPTGGTLPVEAPVATAPAAPAVTTPAVVAPAVVAPAVVAPAVNGEMYTVIWGDYMFGIANALNVRINDLLKVNGIDIASVLVPGQVLKVPADKKATPAPTTTVAGTTVPGATSTTVPADGSSSTTTLPAGPQTPATTADPLSAVVAYSVAQVGKGYAFFSAGPVTFDCSGLVVAAYKQAGITLIHHSGTQAKAGTEVDFMSSPILPGDLVFTGSTATPDVITHVGIAIDSMRWVQAVGPGKPVRIGSIPAKEKIKSVRRILPAAAG